MKRIHYLLLGLLVSLTIAAVSPSLPPTRIIAGNSTITVVTNGLNNYTLTASGMVGASNGFATNLSVYSSGTTNRPLRVFGTNGTSEVYVSVDGLLQVPNGTASEPSYGFASDSANDTGFYRISENVIGASSGGTACAYLYNGGLFIKDQIGLGSTPLGPDVYIVRNSAGVLTVNNFLLTADGNGLLLTRSSGNVTIGSAGGGTKVFVNANNSSSYISVDSAGLLTTVGAASGIVIGGSLEVGSAGTAITNIVSATATLNFASILAAGYEDLTITVTGAVVNDPVILGPPATILAGASFQAWVTAADTVTVRCNNVGSIAVDPASATYRVTVISH
jgi:hypothetical protein